CGHAAACRYGGAPPRVIGAGFYPIWPALYTNVTHPHPLSPARRVRTDPRGVYLNPGVVLPPPAGRPAPGVPPPPAALLPVPPGVAGGGAAAAGGRRLLHPGGRHGGARPVPPDRAGAAQPDPRPARRSPGPGPQARRAADADHLDPGRGAAAPRRTDLRR